MKRLLLVLLLTVLPLSAAAGTSCQGIVAVCEGRSETGFTLIAAGKPALLVVEPGLLKGPVGRAFGDFAGDLKKVSGAEPEVGVALDGVTGQVVIVGQIGTGGLIDQWAAQGIIDVSDVAGVWEGYKQIVVEHPRPGIDRALVIAGADPRGAIYGMYDISAKIGVSPWYWWADVPVVQKTDLYVTPGAVSDHPRVKYRGFFINDEEPALGSWARETFGGINAQFYGHVFELNLRLKGNYLWPAMWGKAFSVDDPQNQATAKAYGIVMGTSHHEPMTRAQAEWHKDADGGVTGGKWDYIKNAENLRTFWRGGIERMQSGGYENIVTLGMRGDGDEPMTEGTATQLLEQIVHDQRRIIADVTGKPVEQTPQVWALYKEVQDYYDHGMQVPDDVTLLFSDDNWGQIRRLPTPGAPKRAGGYGVYYHFDYVGGPRNYKWLNTNQVEKVWQQMDLAYGSGADRLWIVNVGDIKPMEFPLSFFMDMAWNPEAMTPQALEAYPEKWAAQQFGPEIGRQAGPILTRYSQMAAWRKPELIDADSFIIGLNSNHDVTDWARMRDATTGLATRTAAMEIDARYSAAWFQLVDYPVQALANHYELYYRVAQNRMAAAHDYNPNERATQAEAAFVRDKVLSDAYHALIGGKWNHMMSQTHIGYTGWQQPDTQVMPEVVRRASADNVEPIISEYRRKLDAAIVVEAAHYTRKFDGLGVSWQIIPHLGRTMSSVLSLPQTATPTTDGSVRLEYDVTLKAAADTTLSVYLAPTLDTAGKGGLKLAVSIDDRAPQMLSFDMKPDDPQWTRAVSDNILVLQAAFPGLPAGKHTIKVFRIDGNVVLERLVLDTGGLKPSYLGPPESFVR